MVSLGHVALDDTEVQANASEHKAMSHERMLIAEKQLAKEINALIHKAEILVAARLPRSGCPGGSAIGAMARAPRQRPAG
jgi:hypothetical protein